MIKKYLTIILLFIICIGCNRKPDDFYKVIKIKDGDTIALLDNENQTITVRLAEIDCPEKSQAFGQAAKKFTSAMCFGKFVKLVGNSHDKYGRTIALVILQDGTNVNYQLVKNGYAWHYKKYSQNGGLALFEEQARDKKLGLWQDAHPTPPWEFRKASKPPYRGDTRDSLQNKPLKNHYRKHRQSLEEVV